MSKHYYTYLALGDSYTIGESVPLHDSFPYQTVQALRKAGYPFQAPEIVAQTGWTSTELAEHLLHTTLNESYDFVSLLIGVNNQYRGLALADFETDFVFLLHKAIRLAGNKADHVFVLSIPDWGVTPFAAGRDTAAISKEIDRFNQLCESIASANRVHYIDITQGTRQADDDKSLLASDQLHYSGKAHAVWAAKVATIMQQLSHK
jgi:lysophospholipase L1-like esterase